jgi:hypothetical protein
VIKALVHLVLTIAVVFCVLIASHYLSQSVLSLFWNDSLISVRAILALVQLAICAMMLILFVLLLGKLWLPQSARRLRGLRLLLLALAIWMANGLLTLAGALQWLPSGAFGSLGSYFTTFSVVSIGFVFYYLILSEGRSQRREND